MPTPLRRRPSARLLTLGAILGALGAALLLGPAGPVGAQQAPEIKGTAALKWEPATLEIRPGQTVKFTVTGGPPHPVAPADDAPANQRFDASACTTDKMSKVGDSCQIRFARRGTYPFVCQTHLTLGMRGTIYVGVKAPAGEQGGQQGSPTASVAEVAVASPPGGQPAVYYAGYGLLALGALILLAAVAGYVRFAPDFNRERK